MPLRTDLRAVDQEAARVTCTEARGGDVVLRVRGEIIYGEVETVRAALARLPVGTDGVVLDMADVTFMDSAGLRLLKELDDFSRRRGIAVRTTNWQGQPRRVVEFSGYGDTRAEHRDGRLGTADPRDEPPGAASAVALERAEAVRQLREEVRHLQRAMASHPVIDQARGILMAAEACSAEQAWDILRETSQHANVKLRHVAEAVVSSIDGSTPDEPVRGALRTALSRGRAARAHGT
jgi:two-component system, response regulator / RNA-binding antiterminator